MDQLLNWIGQGLVVAVAATVMMHAFGRRSARVRYAVAAVAWLCVVALPALALLTSTASPAGHASAASAAFSPIPLPESVWTSDRLAAAICLAWIAVFGVRVAVGLVALARARSSCTPAPAALKRRLRCWQARRGTGRRARLAISADVRAAAVLAGPTPIIALSPALLASLPDDDLDRVVMHEWAHVQRRDDVAHLAQLVVRAAVGWHPAVAWLDRRLHAERELACDEAAVAATGSARAYAACLARLAALPRASAAVPAPGAARDLRRRIVALLAGRDPVSPRSTTGLAVAAAVALAALSSAVSGVAGIAPAARRLAATPLPFAVVSAASVTAIGPAVETAVAAVRPTVRVRTTNPPALPPAAEDARVADPPGAVEGAAHAAHDSAAVPVFSASGWLSAAPAAFEPSRPTAPAFVTTAAPDTRRSPATPWAAAADGGVAVGRASQQAAVATAGFFSRFGRKVAGAF